MKKAFLTILLLALIFLVSAAGIAEAQPPAVEEFRLARSTDLPTITLELTRLGDDWYFCQDAGLPRKVDASLPQELNRIIRQYDLVSWNGFHGNNPDVLDGEMFSLFIRFSDGSEISAGGSNAFPDGYFDAVQEINALLDGIPVSPAGALPGEYRYEGEGFGGDFTIVLSEDKTFSLYEGYLSSYLGTGIWYQEGARLYLEEGESPYRRFVFMPTVDALFYLADESDSFPYVKAADHARFDKLSQENGPIVADFTFRTFSGGPEYSVRIEDPAVLSCTRFTEYEPGAETIPGASYNITFTFSGLKAGETRVTVLEKSPGSVREIPFLAMVDQWGNISLTPVY